MKPIFWQCGAVIAALVSGALPARGQLLGANLDIGASSSFRGTITGLPGCGDHVANGSASGGTSRSCSGVSGAPYTIDVSAAAAAPAITGDFAQLHASTQVSIDTNRPDVDPHYIEAFAGATFQDLVLLNPGADHLQMSFQLTGTLDGHYDQAAVSQSFVDVSVQAQDGFYDSVSNNGASADPFSEGFASERATFSNGVTTLSSFSGPNNAADFSFTNNGTGLYTLVVGPSFFDNPLNNALILRLALVTDSTVLTRWFFSGDTVDATADFSDTFKMTGLNAFDADGNDITAEVFAGFASDTLPVPEPEAIVGLAAGLLALALSFSRASAPAAPARRDTKPLRR